LEPHVAHCDHGDKCLLAAVHLRLPEVERAVVAGDVGVERSALMAMEDPPEPSALGLHLFQALLDLVARLRRPIQLGRGAVLVG
jgi:hypothetical protein